MARLGIQLVLILSICICVWILSDYAHRDKWYRTGYNDSEKSRQLDVLSGSWDTLFGLINKYKKSAGIPEIKIDNDLCNLAKVRSEEIINDWSHSGFSRSSYKVREIYCPSCVRMSENLARDFVSPEEVMDAWIRSPSHKEVLDEPNTKGCLGYKENNGNMFISFISAR